MALSDGEKGALVAIGLAGLLPIWGSGMNRGLNAYQFLYNHTIWAPRPMYVPNEFLANGEALWDESTRERLGVGRRG